MLHTKVPFHHQKMKTLKLFPSFFRLFFKPCFFFRCECFYASLWVSFWKVGFLSHDSSHHFLQACNVEFSQHYLKCFATLQLLFTCSTSCLLLRFFPLSDVSFGLKFLTFDWTFTCLFWPFRLYFKPFWRFQLYIDFQVLLETSHFSLYFLCFFRMKSCRLLRKDSCSQKLFSSAKSSFEVSNYLGCRTFRSKYFVTEATF